MLSSIGMTIQSIDTSIAANTTISHKHRATELDVIRGFAIFLTIVHHFMYDVHYIFGYPSFSWLFGKAMESFYHLPGYIIFLGVSGVSSSFSRNNLKRSGRLALISIGLTLITSIISIVTKSDYYILWQMLHCLAFSTMLNGLFERTALKEKTKIVILLLTGFLVVFYLPHIIRTFKLDSKGSPLLLPFGIGHLRPEVPAMIDYLPLIPYSGCFFVGVALGKIIYPDGKVQKPYCTGKVFKPLAFMGRHSLLIYAIHQPLLIALIWLWTKIF
ncbi:MAG TPA: DUF1624 domain-containing protein [Clostridiaceae bacterium]|nr:DUF1624 domain-containing protein [Clostridiaceae bacterium]